MVDDKTTKNTTESIQNTPYKNPSLYTIESAASHMVLGPPASQIKYVGWEEDFSAKKQMLYGKLREVEEGWRSQRTLTEITELANHAFSNVNGNYSDLYRKEFEDRIISIFRKNLDLCRRELMDSIARIFMDNKNLNPYRKALDDSIESIFSGFKELNSRHRENLEVHIGSTINNAMDNPDLYCQNLKARIDYLFREKGENKELDSCRQELKDGIDRIFRDVKKSDPYRKALENSIESIFSKHNGLDSYRRNLRDSIDRIFDIDNDSDSYHYELGNSIDAIFAVNRFDLTKPFYEIYYALEDYYKNKAPAISGNPYCKQCKLLEDGIVNDSLFPLCRYCVNGRPQYVKTTQEIYAALKNVLNAEVDKFSLFVFSPDYFKPDVQEKIVQTRHEGIKAWLKRGFDEEIHDMFFNPITEKPEREIIDTPVNLLPLPAVPTADDSNDRPTGGGEEENSKEPETEIIDTSKPTVSPADHPDISKPELKAAMAANKAFEGREPTRKEVKAWLKDNAKGLGLLDEDKNVRLLSDARAEEIASLVNRKGPGRPRRAKK
jgi:hypothetical protein